MGIPRHLAPHRAQAKAFGGIIAGGPDTTIIEDQHLGSAAFQEKLPVIGPRDRVAQMRQSRILVEMRVEWLKGRIGHGTPGGEFDPDQRKRVFAASNLLYLMPRIWF